MSDFNTPDLSRDFSSFQAPHWLMRNGITAALRSDTRVAVLLALYQFLPNVHPGKGAIERLTGKSKAAVQSARQELRELGLISYEDNRGGSHTDTTRYTLADIRRPEIVTDVLQRINAKRARTSPQPKKARQQKVSAPEVTNTTGSTVIPVADANACVRSEQHVSDVTPSCVRSDTSRGQPLSPYGVNGYPGTGSTVIPKEDNTRRQEKKPSAYGGGADAPDPGGVAAARADGRGEPKSERATPNNSCVEPKTGAMPNAVGRFTNQGTEVVKVLGYSPPSRAEMDAAAVRDAQRMGLM